MFAANVWKNWLHDWKNNFPPKKAAPKSGFFLYPGRNTDHPVFGAFGLLAGINMPKTGKALDFCKKMRYYGRHNSVQREENPN